MTYFVEEGRKVIRAAFEKGTKTPEKATEILDAMIPNDYPSQKSLLDKLGIAPYGSTMEKRRQQIEKGISDLFGTGVEPERVKSLMYFTYRMTPANGRRLVSK